MNGTWAQTKDGPKCSKQTELGTYLPREYLKSAESASTWLQYTAKSKEHSLGGGKQLNFVSVKKRERNKYVNGKSNSGIIPQNFQNSGVGGHDGLGVLDAEVNF